jgi:hypothetical protein
MDNMANRDDGKRAPIENVDGKRVLINSVLFDFVEGLSSNPFIAQEYPAVEFRKVDIPPVVVFGIVVKVGRVLGHGRIYRIFERIRYARFLKAPVGMFRKVDFEVASFFGYIGRIAGKES